MLCRGWSDLHKADLPCQRRKVLDRYSTLKLTLIIGATTLLYSLPAQGQSSATIRGRVQDDRGLPVSHAEVALYPSGRRVIASESGSFAFLEVPLGPSELRVRRIGNRPTDLRLSLVGDTAVIVELNAIPTVLDSVRIRERRGQRQFVAVVVDDSGVPIIGAEVIAAGMRSLTTDSTGRAFISDLRRGTLMLRVRKIGYSPFFGSLTIEGIREDTIQIARLAQELDRVAVLAQSGFGRDTFVFSELSSRMKWKTSKAGVISREELASFGRENLCSAMPRTRSGALLGIRDGRPCELPTCILLNGERPINQPLSSFLASDVEAIEYFPPGSDWSGTIFQRAALTCYPWRKDGGGPGKSPGGWVIWLRNR